MRPKLACLLPVLFALLGLCGPAQSQGQPRAPADRLAVIVNETGLTLRELYVSPAGAATDTNDRLGADTIPPGGTWRLRLVRQAGCQFDLRGVFADNSVLDRRGIDLCSVTRVTFGDASAPLREATIANDTDLVLRSLYAAPPGARDRGADRLGSEIVAPGATFRLRLGRTRDCVFDVIAVFEDDTEERRDRADLCRSQRIGFGDPATPVREVEVVNDGQAIIQRLFAAPPGAARPGPDRLGATTLAPGEAFRMTIRTRDCVLELRAEYAAGIETLPAVDLCTTRRIAFDGRRLPPVVEQSVTLVNRHGATIQEAYASAADSDDWGPDRLEAGVLEIGQRRVVTLGSGCEVDLRVVFPNGGAEERRAVDVCAVPIVVVRPGWTIADRLGEGAGGDPAPIAPPAPGSIRLRNAGPLPIVALFIDAPGALRGDAPDALRGDAPDALRGDAPGALRGDAPGALRGDAPDALRGPDRLGDAVLAPGTSLDFRPPPGLGCNADLVAVFRDGREVARPALDLCAGQEVSLP